MKEEPPRFERGECQNWTSRNFFLTLVSKATLLYNKPEGLVHDEICLRN